MTYTDLSWRPEAIETIQIDGRILGDKRTIFKPSVQIEGQKFLLLRKFCQLLFCVFHLLGGKLAILRLGNLTGSPIGLKFFWVIGWFFEIYFEP